MTNASSDHAARAQTRRPLALDLASLLVEARGDDRVDDVEADLTARGLTLAANAAQHAGLDVDTWLARGLPGARAPLADPADHLVAGLEATLRDGRRLVVRPAPRRAVGPDLMALVVGMGGRFARVDRVWLRVHPIEGARPALPLPDVEPDPPLTEAETRLVDAIARELFGPTRER